MTAQRDAELAVLGAALDWYALRCAERSAQCAGLPRNASPSPQAPSRRALLDAESVLDAAVVGYLEAQ